MQSAVNHCSGLEQVITDLVRDHELTNYGDLKSTDRFRIIEQYNSALGQPTPLWTLLPKQDRFPSRWLFLRINTKRIHPRNTFVAFCFADDAIRIIVCNDPSANKAFLTTQEEKILLKFERIEIPYDDTSTQPNHLINRLVYILERAIQYGNRGYSEQAYPGVKRCAI